MTIGFRHSSNLVINNTICRIKTEGICASGMSDEAG